MGWYGSLNDTCLRMVLLLKANSVQDAAKQSRQVWVPTMLTNVMVEWESERRNICEYMMGFENLNRDDTFKLGPSRMII